MPCPQDLTGNHLHWCTSPPIIRPYAHTHNQYYQYGSTTPPLPHHHLRPRNQSHNPSGQNSKHGTTTAAAPPQRTVSQPRRACAPPCNRTSAPRRTPRVRPPRPSARRGLRPGFQTDANKEWPAAPTHDMRAGHRPEATYRYEHVGRTYSVPKINQSRTR